jgi:hypothetical protein
MADRKSWLISIAWIAILCIIASACIALEGCATMQGVIPEQVITQSAAVDSSISQLQTQQAESAVTVEQVSATADAIETTAAEIKNEKLTGQITTLKTQVKNLSGSLSEERNKTAEIQKKYSDLKVTSGTELINYSKQINKLSAQLKLSHKWNFILGGIGILLILGYVAIMLLKFYFKKI